MLSCFSTGIIDRPDAIDQVHRDFMKSLIWLLVRYVRNVSKQRSKLVSSISDDPSQDRSKQRSDGCDGDVFLRATNESRNFVSPTVKLKTSAGVHETLNGKEPKRKASDLSGSIGSLASILASDDGQASRLRPKSKTGAGSVKLPGAVSDEEDDDWDGESAFSDSGFGLPAVDVSRRKKQGNNPSINKGKEKLNVA